MDARCYVSRPATVRSWATGGPRRAVPSGSADQGRGNRDAALRRARAPTVSPISASSAAAWTAVSRMSWRPGAGCGERAPEGVPVGCLGCCRRALWPDAEVRLVLRPVVAVRLAPAGELRLALDAELPVAVEPPWLVELALAVGRAFAVEPVFRVELALAVEPVFRVELALAVELRFAPALAARGLPAAVTGFGADASAGVDACAEAVSAGRAARFWLRRCGRELGNPPSTSDERRSLISATSSHQARF
jgi:hypothetical protein